ncbi:MAG: aminopeptidase P N-terminal domain-containing protein [Phycisphaerales bacterium]
MPATPPASSATASNPAASDAEAFPVSGPTVPAMAYAERRRALGEQLGGGIGLVFAGKAGHEEANWRPHPHFEYLCGVTDEPNAMLLLDPNHPVESRRAILFRRPLDPELEQWDGLREPVTKALRDRYGVGTIHRTDRLGRVLSEIGGRTRRLVCVHPLATIDQPVSPDLAVFRRVAERTPGVDIVDGSSLIPAMRAVKDGAEVAMIRHAGAITARGFAAALDTVRPGISEFALQQALEHTYRMNGSRGPAYGTIVGSEINSTVLHYRANDRTIQADEVICIDSGAEYGGYGADVTRTIPSGGRFTPRQRELYSIVLESLDAGIAAVKAGATMADVDRASRKIINDAGYGDFFIHGIGHHLGLETHDTCGSGPLEVGAVVTVEPGIYLPDEGIGIRIEDDIVVTEGGNENLTGGIPRTIDEIEAAIGGN